MKRYVILILLCICVTEVYSAGFRVALQSSRQQGMAHVGAGMDTGAAGIFFNPGTLAMLEGTSVSLTGTAILADNQFNQPGTTITSELEDNLGTPVALYINHKLNDSWAVGLGAYTPYGNVVEWPENWAGQFISEKVELKTYFIQPTISYKISDKVGIGAGLIYSLGTVELKRSFPLTTVPPSDVLIETDGFASGIGYNAGIFLKPSEDLTFGINYRSKIEVDAEDGDISIDPAFASPLFAATKFDATLPLPAEAAVGVGFNLSEKLMIGADFNYIFWSQYEELKFDFNGDFGGVGVTSSVIPQNWSDALTVKLGGEYDLNEKFDLRAGIYYDYTPIPDATLGPITPDANRLGITGGIGYQSNGALSVDASLLYLRGEERTVQAADNQFGFAQRYLITVLAPSLGINFEF